MNLGGKPHPLDRDILERKRRSYACILCTDIYHQEPKLWEHAVNSHQESLGDLTSKETAESARRKFRQQALDKAQNKAGTEKAGAPSADPNYASDFIDTGYPGAKEARLHGTSAVVSALGNVSNKKLDEKGRVAEPERELSYISNGGDSISSPHRSVRVNTTSPMRIGHIDSAGRPSAKVSRVPELTQSASLGVSEYKRPLSGSKQPLYDPNTDKRQTRLQQGHSSQQMHEQVNQLQSSSRRSRATGPGGWDSRPRIGTGHASRQQHDAYSIEKPEQPFRYESDQENPSSIHSPTGDNEEGPDAPPEMLLQPETRAISHEQLVIEVKGIYAGLVMVEAKCIDVDEKQIAAAQERDPLKRTKLKDDQYQSLIALHKQLLHEHHDFFLASQHPSASPALSKLAAKYSMPARMWRHGIHTFLEVLRHRLPESLEHMLAFIYIAYSMMALLFETVSTFEDTWIECLGDLGRYRMAIENDDPKDRDIWSNVARFWYNKAADKSPMTGRLYHHLAILAKPYSLEQLASYIRALTCIIPFDSARGSIMTLFGPILNGKDANARRTISLETSLIKAHGILFTSEPLQSPERFNTVIQELIRHDVVDTHIRKANTGFKENGAFAAIANIGALFEYGSSKLEGSKPILQAGFYSSTKRARNEVENMNIINKTQTVSAVNNNGSLETGAEDLALHVPEASLLIISQASRLAFYVFSICLKWPKDQNVLPLVHIYLAFLWGLVGLDEAGALIENDIPRQELCSFLNALSSELDILTGKDASRARSSLESRDFPEPDQRPGRPLPEDYLLRCQQYTREMFPDSWFTDAAIDDDERSVEIPSTNVSRIKRILWLAHGIAFARRWIFYDKEAKYFVTTDTMAANLAALDRSTVADEDSVMLDDDAALDTPGTLSISASNSYDSNVEFTPKTRSYAASESYDEVIVSTTEASPLAMQTSVASHGISPARTPDVEGQMYDSPMLDISPGKSDQPMEGLGNSPKEGIAPWFSDAELAPRSSPHVEKARDDFGFHVRKDYGFNEYDRDDAETYKP